ncbi:MAG: zinc ribbon domain-containing protein [Ilumatobacteraceae bacterium]
MFCPTCGAPIQPAQRYCMDCGTSLAATSAVAPTVVTRQTAGKQPAGTATAELFDAVPERPVSVPQPPPPGYRPAVRRVEPSAHYGDGSTPINVVEQTSADLYATPLWTPPAYTDPWPTNQQRLLSAEAFDRVPLSVFAIITGVVGLIAGMLKVGSFQNGDGLSTGFKVSDLSSNAITTMLIVVLVLVVGVALCLAGWQIGAGLAVGAGLAISGVAMLNIALVTYHMDSLKQQASGTGSVTVNYEFGFYVMIGAAVFGAVAFLVSLGANGGDFHRRFNMGVCALGALAALAVAFGPMVPGKGTGFSDNLNTDTAPGTFLWLRIGALLLIAVAGVVGFMSRRQWGIGVVIGGLAAAVVQWIGTIPTTHPLTRTSVGIFSVGTRDGRPHLAVTIGLGVVAVAAVGAVVIGWLTRNRPVRKPSSGGGGSHGVSLDQLGQVRQLGRLVHK